MSLHTLHASVARRDSSQHHAPAGYSLCYSCAKRDARRSVDVPHATATGSCLFFVTQSSTRIKETKTMGLLSRKDTCTPTFRSWLDKRGAVLYKNGILAYQNGMQEKQREGG